MKRLTLIAGINTYTGYGVMAIALATGLEKAAGCHVSIRPIIADEPFGAMIPADIRARFVNGTQPEEFELLVKQPNFRPTPGKKTICFTMMETSRLPKES